MKVVLDTNIVISGVLCGGKPRKILDMWRDGFFDLVISNSVVMEYDEVLYRSKFGLPFGIAEAILSSIVDNSIKVSPTTRVAIIVEDPEDNKFLECAVEGEADYIVSGDKHLLNLKNSVGLK